MPEIDGMERGSSVPMSLQVTFTSGGSRFWCNPIVFWAELIPEFKFLKITLGHLRKKSSISYMI